MQSSRDVLAESLRSQSVLNDGSPRKLQTLHGLTVENLRVDPAVDPDIADYTFDAGHRTSVEVNATAAVDWTRVTFNLLDSSSNHHYRNGNLGHDLGKMSVTGLRLVPGANRLRITLSPYCCPEAPAARRGTDTLTINRFVIGGL